MSFKANATEHMPLTSIRGIAALWVVGCHLAGALKTITPEPVRIALDPGWLGVDVFFILSGFILALVYQDMSISNAPAFLWKRLVRVYPLNIFLTSIVAGLALIGIPYGVFINWPALPYFYAMTESLLSVPVGGWISTNWSVGVELLCYLAFPFVIAAIRRFPSIVLAVAAAAMLTIEYRVSAQQMTQWWGTGAIMRGASGFGLGMILGTLALSAPRSLSRFSSAIEVSALLAIVLCVWTGEINFVPPLAGILILSLYFDAGVIARALHNKWLFRLGLISYSVYLIHGVLLGRYNYNAIIWAKSIGGWQAALLWSTIFLACTFTVSALTYRFVEQPCRKIRFGRVHYRIRRAVR